MYYKEWFQETPALLEISLKTEECWEISKTEFVNLWQRYQKARLTLVKSSPHGPEVEESGSSGDKLIQIRDKAYRVRHQKGLRTATLSKISILN